MSFTSASSPPRASGVAGHLGVAVGLAALTVAAWSLLLRWDQHKYLNSAGTLSGPYRAWQVVALGAVLVVAIVAVARAGYGYAALAVPLALTVCFSIAGATDPYADGLWPVGSMMVLVGSGLGTFGVAALASRHR